MPDYRLHWARTLQKVSTVTVTGSSSDRQCEAVSSARVGSSVQCWHLRVHAYSSMGRFSVAAILAALCPQLCLYSSSNSSSYFQCTVCSNQEEGLGTGAGWCSGQQCSSCCGGVHLLNRLDDTFSPRTMGSLLCSLLVSKCTTQLGGTTGYIMGHIHSRTSSSDSKSAECVSYQVKYQHNNNNYRVKTLDRQLCSIWAQSSISLHIHAPFPLHCLCDSECAASMGCGQQTSTNHQQGCILRCLGGQAAAVHSQGYMDIG